MNPNSSRPGKDVALRETAYLWLKAHIRTIPRDEGAFLTESTVCEATGSSRTPVREALLQLQAEGLLQIMPKKGAFIRPIPDSEIVAVMEARLVMEEWCLRRTVTASLLEATDLERLLKLQGESRDDPVRFIEADREFHRVIVRAAGNSVFNELGERLRERQLRMGITAIAGDEERLRDVIDEHTGVVEAVRRGDANAAAEALQHHLRSTFARVQRVDGRRPSADGAHLGGAL